MRSLLVVLAATTAAASGSATWQHVAIAELTDDEAARHLELHRALLRRPGASCQALHRAALLEERAGSATAARDRIERATRLCPDVPAITFDHGRLLAAHGCLEAALSALERAIWLAPDDGAARALRDDVRAQLVARLGDLDRRIGELGRQAADGQRGLLDEWRAVRAALDAHLGHDAADPGVLLRLAEVERIGGELGVPGAHVRALDAVRRALDRRGEWGEALVLLGTLELTGEPSRPEAAERAFLVALTAAPERTLPAWTGLLFTHLSIGRWRSAIAAADACLALDPTDATIRGLRDRARAEAEFFGRDGR